MKTLRSSLSVRRDLAQGEGVVARTISLPKEKRGARRSEGELCGKSKKMDERESLELKWREEFERLGESGVQRELHKGSLLGTKGMEEFAYRWLKEKCQERLETEQRGWRALMVVAILGISIFATVGVDMFR
jgi:hypothetical protein